MVRGRHLQPLHPVTLYVRARTYVRTLALGGFGYVCTYGEGWLCVVRVISRRCEGALILRRDRRRLKGQLQSALEAAAALQQTREVPPDGSHTQPGPSMIATSARLVMAAIGAAHPLVLFPVARC
jgi:hypothetical protein